MDSCGGGYTASALSGGMARGTNENTGTHRSSGAQVKSETDHSKKRPWYRVPIVESFLADTGALAVFGVRFVRTVFQPPFEIQECLKQSYLIGNKSLGLVGITGFIIGLVLKGLKP